MGVLPDHLIRQYVELYSMIEPFEPETVRNGKISYGTSSYGYDLRLANEFTRIRTEGEWDPKNPANLEREHITADIFVIQPGETILARSYEYFRIPRHVLGLVYGKSTYARCGVLVNVTPLEPEWEGYITMAIANCSKYLVRLYAYEGIAQVVFITGEDMCKISYADRKGKYQGQKGIVLPHVENEQR